MASYIIFWAKDRIENYLKNGDKGPLSVIFGGPHQSQPPLGKINIGDTIFPITVISGKMYVLGRMEIGKIITKKEYTEEYLTKNNINIDNEMWDTYCNKNKKTITHKIPWNCMDNAAIEKMEKKYSKENYLKTK